MTGEYGSKNFEDLEAERVFLGRHLVKVFKDIVNYMVDDQFEIGD